MDTNSSNSRDALTILNTVFDYPAFRSKQEEIINNVLAGRNTLAILPTGAGKSLCFQIPALIFDGLTIVVSPLIALMKDQVDGLKKKGVLDVAYINSMLDQSTKERIYEQLKSKQSNLKMLYVAPETFVDNKLMRVLRSCNISLIAIDEVHCISVWGHNFRPDYLRLRRMIRVLNHPAAPPVLGLTATATRTVEEDVQEQLGIKCDVFKASFDRKNLFLSVLNVNVNRNVNCRRSKEKIIKTMLKLLDGSVIVYVNFTKTAEELAAYLADAGFSASYYHGQIRNKETRRRVQNDFISGRTRIVVATNAFGMGIDKENIRAIVHFELPKSIESYYQEVGRAGRDGKPAYCLLLYSDADEFKVRKLVQYNTPSREQIEEVLRLLTEASGKLMYVNVKRIANDLKLDEVPIRLILHHLERMGVIKTHFRIFRRAAVRIMRNDTESLKQPQEVERVMRNGYFRDNLNGWMDLEDLSRSVQIPVGDLNEMLRDLKASGRLKLEERDFCTPVSVNRGIKDVDTTELLEIFSRVEDSGMRKIDKVLEYVESEECKRKFILDYFGESYSGNCNACNICNPSLSFLGADTDIDIEAKTKTKPEEFVDETVIEDTEGIGKEASAESTRIAFAVLELVNNLDFRVGRTSLANILIGSKSKRIINQNLQESRYYGVLKRYTAREVVGIIDQLIAKGFLLKRHDNSSNYPRPLLYLTERAANALEERTAIELQLPVKNRQEVSEPENPDVLDELKKWRRDIAAERNIPAYCVFHDSTLIGIANRLPKTEDELEEIKGIGRRKIEDYGKAVLRMVRLGG